MKLKVKHKTRNGEIHDETHTLGYYALIKHIVGAGTGKFSIFNSPYHLRKFFGALLYYNEYLNRRDFDHGKFSHPPESSNYYDPTELSQFSCIAGKGIADFLAKQIDNAIFSVGYEAFLKQEGMKLNGTRADLVLFKNNEERFVLESKGRKSKYEEKTLNDALQQKQKGLSVLNQYGINFGVVCASFNLYNNIKSYYYDPPFGREIKRNSTLKELSKLYYKAFFEILKNSKSTKTFKYKGEVFIKIELPEFSIFENHPLYNASLIVPHNIEELSETGISENNIHTFKKSKIDDNELIYIDNDKIGFASNNYEF